MPDFNIGDFTLDLNALVSGIIPAAFIMVAAFVVQRIVRPKLLRWIISRAHEEAPDELAVRTDTLAKSVVGMASYVIWLVAGPMVLNELGVNIAPILASAGVIGVAVGFASQDIIRGYIHGFFILTEDWYREGEGAVVAGTGGLVE